MSSLRNDVLIEKFRRAGINIDGNPRPYWNRSICPKCNEIKTTKAKDLGFNMETGAIHCHKCGWSANVIYETKKEYSRPQEKEWKPSDNVKEYLFSRGISESTFNKLIKQKLIAYTNKPDVFAFQYYRGDEFINYKTRSCSGEKTFLQHRDAEKTLYNLNSARDKEIAIIVEGEMSVLACIEAGLDEKYAILSLENGAVKEGSAAGKFAGFRNCFKETAHIKRWIVALDNDQAGTYTASELIRHIGEYKCNIIQYPEGCKDPDDIINRNKRPNYTSFENNEVLRKMFENSVEYPVTGIIELSPTIKAMLMGYKKHGRPPAIMLPMFEGSFAFKRGDYTVVSGYVNTGKSTIAMNMAYLTTMEYLWKWAIFAGEQHPQDRYFEDLAQMILKKPIEERDRFGKPIEGCATPDEYEAALEFISNHIYLIYPEAGQKPTLEWTMERVLHLKEKYGINGVIIDTFNKLKHDFKNQRDDVYLDDWHDKAKEYALQFDAFVLLMHPAKPSKLKSGNLPVMSIYDIAGGAMTPNKVDNVIIYHRDSRFSEEQIPNNIATVIFGKIRDQKTVGKIGQFKVEYFPEKNNFKYGVNGFSYNKTLAAVTGQIIQSVADENYIDTEEIPF